MFANRVNVSLRAIFVNSPKWCMCIYTSRANNEMCESTHNILYRVEEEQGKRGSERERCHSCETRDAKSPMRLMHSEWRVL